MGQQCYGTGIMRRGWLIRVILSSFARKPDSWKLRQVFASLKASMKGLRSYMEPACWVHQARRGTVHFGREARPIWKGNSVMKSIADHCCHFYYLPAVFTSLDVSQSAMFQCQFCPALLWTVVMTKRCWSAKMHTIPGIWSSQRPRDEYTAYVVFWGPGTFLDKEPASKSFRKPWKAVDVRYEECRAGRGKWNVAGLHDIYKCWSRLLWLSGRG